MRRSQLVALGSAAVLLAACADSPTPTQPLAPGALDLAAMESMDLDPAMSLQRKVHPTVQQARERQAARGIQAGPPMLYHVGGRIIPLPRVAAIYWSNSVIYAGGPTPGTVGAGSADGSVVGQFMRSLGGTPFWSINNEYTDTCCGGHRVANSLTYTYFHANDVGAPVSGDTVSDAQIRSMLGSVVGSASLPFNQQTIYAVFSGPGVNLGGGFGTQYCAYHGFFPRPGYPGQWIIYTVQPHNADFVGACTAVNTPASGSPNDDFAADATINVLSHELEEAVTDPGLNAWYDAFGQENADKCAWTFGTLFTVPNGSKANVTFAGKNYLIQRNWRLGPNLSNQVGCRLN
ncbi:MAG: hypothetical protein MNPFHGCM_02720 [Gemmatimonadaceae bacterium]|nr:hypothetical protein [Gemmatimonadaceae bacterium]